MNERPSVPADDHNAEPDATRPDPISPTTNLDDPALYLNRELTWLAFNHRVLHEAADPRTPLLERVKFLAIVSNNLDEFFMKRIGGLKQQIAAGMTKTSVDGRTPVAQIEACQAVCRELHAKQKQVWDRLIPQLADQGIQITRVADLPPATHEQLREYFGTDIFPILTPLAMDPAHPFPFISNLALNLLVTLRFPGADETHMARVKVPVAKDISKRLIAVDGGRTFVTLDDLMIDNLDQLFPGMEIESCARFRVTRNAIVEPSEEAASDLLEMIETELRERHFAPIVRLEVEQGMAPVHRGMLAAELGLNEDEDVFETEGMLAMRDLLELAALDIPELHDEPHHPVEHPLLVKDRRNIFHIIRENGPLLLQHPYQPFATTVERFIDTAAEDPKVLAIKMTLYRTSAEGKILDSLTRASRNGKQVAVLVELKARFDEAANIRWARRLEAEGIHVNYGVLGLKTHCKLIFVVRRDYAQLRRYYHIGTGNYHPGTSKLYTDLGILGCDEDLGQDITELFNYITGYSPPHYRKALVAPYRMKQAILEWIRREIRHQEAGREGHIQIKMNALEDVDITRALYEASRAGVRVDLIVRDTCRFRPNIPGLSESARVVSIVGRFLEHARVLYFRNGGDEVYYIGSADMMQRNLESRVEIHAPVEDSALRQELRLILDAQLADQRSAWDMQPDGTYRQRRPDDDSTKGVQEILIGVAKRRLVAASRHKEKKIRSRLIGHFQRRLRSNKESS